MRLLAIGDIHGCLTAFDALLDAVAPADGDRLIALGDYVDRGPDSRGVLDRLIELHSTGQLIALRGNHDVMMLQARQGNGMIWLACGGRETLSSYDIAADKWNALGDEDDWSAGSRELLAPIPQRHWQFLGEDCRRYYETEKHIFVHANVHPHLPLEGQPDYILYWEKMIESCAHVSGKIVICGHTRQRSGRPLDLGTSICIDTNIYDNGWLTCLDVGSGRFWQANEQGQTRDGWLGDGT